MDVAQPSGCRFCVALEALPGRPWPWPSPFPCAPWLAWPLDLPQAPFSSARPSPPAPPALPACPAPPPPPRPPAGCSEMGGRGGVGEGPRSLELCVGDRLPTPFTTAEGGPSCLTSDPNLLPLPVLCPPLCLPPPQGPSLAPPSLLGSRPDHVGPAPSRGRSASPATGPGPCSCRWPRGRGPGPARMRVSSGPRALSRRRFIPPRALGWPLLAHFSQERLAMWAARAQGAGPGPGAAWTAGPRRLRGGWAMPGTSEPQFPHLQTPLSRTAFQALRDAGRRPRHTEPRPYSLSLSTVGGALLGGRGAWAWAALGLTGWERPGVAATSVAARSFPAPSPWGPPGPACGQAAPTQRGAPGGQQGPRQSGLLCGVLGKVGGSPRLPLATDGGGMPALCPAVLLREGVPGAGTSRGRGPWAGCPGPLFLRRLREPGTVPPALSCASQPGTHAGP